jgi:hypothetical protein
MTKRMTYEEFIDFVKSECVLETIYKDSEGRLILVIALLDAYIMVNKVKRPWVGLTDEEKETIYKQADAENWHDQPLLETVEAKLKEKNT